MHEPSSRLGRLILSSCPVPDEVAAMFAETYSELFSFNATLTGAQRTDWLVRRPPSDAAQRLALHRFDLDDAVRVVAVERRTSVLRKLTTQASTEVLDMMAASKPKPVMVAAASRMMIRRRIRTDLLAPRIDDLPPELAFAVAAEASVDELSDARVAELFIAHPLDTAKLWSIQNQVAAASVFRPGLLAEFSTPQLPLCSWAATALSSTLTLADLNRLGSSIALSRGHFDHLHRIAESNPWLAGDGEALTAPIPELDADGVAIAWQWWRTLNQSVPGRSHLVAAFAMNPNLGDLANEVLLELKPGRYDGVTVPLWAQPVIADVWARHYPHLTFDSWAVDSGEEYEQTGPGELVVSDLFDRDVGATGPLHAHDRERLAVHISRCLGEDPGVWAAAVLLADSAASPAELVELALATAGVEPASR
jgi:hypothetical protein